MCTKYKA